MPLVWIYIMFMCAFYSLYEIGYIENDVITTQDEANPTIRAAGIERIYLRRNFRVIISLKYLISALILFIISMSGVDIYIKNLVISMVSLRAVFMVHNKMHT